MGFRLLILLSLFSLQSCPDKEEFNYYEAGIASYYHDALEGNLTANGEVFSQDSMTAAHRTLPFGTMVLVERVSNEKRIWLRINDRGPFNYKRIIDLSRSAADSLDLIQAGIDEVIIKAVVPDEFANIVDD